MSVDNAFLRCPRCLEELRLTALEGRIEADLARGVAAPLVPELEVLVRKHPHRERLRGQLMIALYRSGRQGEALAAYQDALSVRLGALQLRVVRRRPQGPTAVRDDRLILRSNQSRGYPC